MTEAFTDNSGPNPLLVLMDLSHRARRAASREELGFLLTNDSKLLFPYRQAALWFESEGIITLSGLLKPEANAPYSQWLDKVCRALARTDLCSETPGPRPVTTAELDDALSSEWSEWLPEHAVWLPIQAQPDRRGSTPGGLLLAGEFAFPEPNLALLGEWLDAWSHAWWARHRPPPWSLALWKSCFLGWLAEGDTARKWWQRRRNQALMIVAALLLLPVRLTVLAPGELVPANPFVIRAPLDGVISQFHVRPNELVKPGQPLFSFDEAPTAARLEVARQALATAETEYRQSAQLALSDSKSKGQLAAQLGKIGEKRAEVDYLGTQFERSHVASPQAGIALFDDPTEWIGRPVQTGERIMRIAIPDQTEIEAWLPLGDMIPLTEGGTVKLYLAASPFSGVNGEIRYVSHEAVARPDGTYAYRLRARLVDPDNSQRIGLKGTAKVHGGWVPFSYWVIRRPLATIRQMLAL